MRFSTISSTIICQHKQLQAYKIDTEIRALSLLYAIAKNVQLDGVAHLSYELFINWVGSLIN